MHSIRESSTNIKVIVPFLLATYFYFLNKNWHFCIVDKWTDAKRLIAQTQDVLTFFQYKNITVKFFFHLYSAQYCKCYQQT